MTLGSIYMAAMDKIKAQPKLNKTSWDLLVMNILKKWRSNDE